MEATETATETAEEVVAEEEAAEEEKEEAPPTPSMFHSDGDEDEPEASTEYIPRVLDDWTGGTYDPTPVELTRDYTNLDAALEKKNTEAVEKLEKIEEEKEAARAQLKKLEEEQKEVAVELLKAKIVHQQEFQKLEERRRSML